MDQIIIRRGKALPTFRYFRRALCQFHCVTAPSGACARSIAQYWGLDTDPFVLPNAVDPSQFSANPSEAHKLREKLGIPHGTPIILYVGRVCTQKGTDILLEAFSILRAKHKVDAELLVAGPAEQFGNTKRTSLVDRISAVGGIYLGPVPERLLPAIFTAAAVSVLPSREETFGLAALEAQACSCPVVCSDVGGLPEVVPPEVGYRVRPGDAVALAGVLDRILGDGSARLRMSAAARENSLRFSYSRVATRLQAIYDEQVEAKRKSGKGQRCQTRVLA
jgi:D-inositol-3-phosphate glycosyltransferase